MEATALKAQEKFQGKKKKGRKKKEKELNRGWQNCSIFNKVQVVLCLL